MFSNANDNQGLKEVAGSNYGQRAETIMKSFISSNKSTEAISKFKIPLDNYELT